MKYRVGNFRLGGGWVKKNQLREDEQGNKTGEKERKKNEKRWKI